MSVTARRYERRGVLAINPRALFESYLVDDERVRENTEEGDCVIIDIRGPLENHAHPWCDSYEAILERCMQACATGCRAVVLRFDSPGGDVSGCFDTAVAIRAACDLAGKQLHAYVEGECASAAYAIASQCMTITLSLSALVGSIGVLSTREDISEMNAARGLRVAFITSGIRKADGHPEMPLTDAELASTQDIVDSMASVFFDLVAEGRALKPLAVAQLQARTFHGEAAVRAGLADAVGPLTTVLALAGPNGGTGMGLRAKKMSYEDLRAALAEAAEGDDPNAAAAKRALAAMDEHMEPDGDEGPPAKKDATSGDTTPPKDKESDKPAPASTSKRAEEGEEARRRAEGEGEEARRAEAEDGTEAKSAAAAYRLALQAQSRVAALQAQLQARDEATERAQLIASRPDMHEDMVSILQRAPIDLVREHVKGLPPLKAAAGGGGLKNPRVAALGAKPTLGKDQAGGASHLPPDEKAQLDARMGLVAEGLHVVNSDYKLELGAYKPR